MRLGTNAQSQWDNVLDKIDKVDLVTVTGWNEWVAIKQVFDGRVGFVDTADEEFSRDIEPPKGDGYQDAFYLQLCDNIRRFKGIKGDMPKPALKSLPLAPDPAAWEGCAVYATAALGLARSWAGVGQNLRYEQPAPPQQNKKRKGGKQQKQRAVPYRMRKRPSGMRKCGFHEPVYRLRHPVPQGLGELLLCRFSL